MNISIEDILQSHIILIIIMFIYIAPLQQVYNVLERKRHMAIEATEHVTNRVIKSKDCPSKAATQAIREPGNKLRQIKMQDTVN